MIHSTLTTYTVFRHSHVIVISVPSLIDFNLQTD